MTPLGVSIALTASDLALYVSEPLERIERMLDQLAGQRIVRTVAPSPGSSRPRYEIFHDSLAPALLEWRQRAELSQEHRRQRRRMVRITSVMTLLLVLVGLLLVLLVYSLSLR